MLDFFQQITKLLIMKGKEFKQLLRLNGLRQEDAAKIFDVSRPTISVWCNSEEIDDKIVRIILERFRVTDPNISPISVVNGSSNAVGNVNSNIDLRQYNSDSPDVLRAQIDVLDERIREKDAQIREKDAQIKDLHEIIKQLSQK